MQGLLAFRPSSEIRLGSRTAMPVCDPPHPEARGEGHPEPTASPPSFQCRRLRFTTLRRLATTPLPLSERCRGLGLGSVTDPSPTFVPNAQEARGDAIMVAGRPSAAPAPDGRSCATLGPLGATITTGARQCLMLGFDRATSGPAGSPARLGDSTADEAVLRTVATRDAMAPVHRDQLRKGLGGAFSLLLLPRLCRFRLHRLRLHLAGSVRPPLRLARRAGEGEPRTTLGLRERVPGLLGLAHVAPKCSAHPLASVLRRTAFFHPIRR